MFLFVYFSIKYLLYRERLSYCPGNYWPLLLSVYLATSANLSEKYEDAIKMKTLSYCLETVLCVDVLQMMHSNVFFYT